MYLSIRFTCNQFIERRIDRPQTCVFFNIQFFLHNHTLHKITFSRTFFFLTSVRNTRASIYSSSVINYNWKTFYSVYVSFSCIFGVSLHIDLHGKNKINTTTTSIPTAFDMMMRCFFFWYINTKNKIMFSRYFWFNKNLTHTIHVNSILYKVYENLDVAFENGIHLNVWSCILHLKLDFRL